jgi:hypothetical protein
MNRSFEATADVDLFSERSRNGRGDRPDREEMIYPIQNLVNPVILSKARIEVCQTGVGAKPLNAIG